MGNNLSVYGTPQKVSPVPLVAAAPSLQEQINVLQKRKAFLEKTIEFDNQRIKQAKTKEEAYRYLKQKQAHENELNSIFAMLDKLEGLDSARERLQFQKDMIAVTSNATAIIQNNMVDANKAETVMENAEELINNVNEVSNILSNNFQPDYQLREEVEAMFAEREKKPDIIQFPDVPIQMPAVPKQQQTTSEDRLASLA
jgi:hypothetical protein